MTNNDSIVDLSVSLKANILSSLGVSAFLLMSIITILDSKNSVNHLNMIKGLLFLSILILAVTLFSFCDDYYNKVALADDNITVKQHIDALLHISMVLLLIILEISFVIVRLRKI